LPALTALKISVSHIFTSLTNSDYLITSLHALYVIDIRRPKKSSEQDFCWRIRCSESYVPVVEPDLSPCDVVVIGGGLVGTSLCFELVRSGLEVVLVDRRHEGRATDAGAGILAPETFLDEDDGWAALARHAGDHHRRLDERVTEDGGEGTGRHECGLVRVSTSEGEDEWLERAYDLAARRSPGVVERLDPSDAVRMFPPLAPVREAIFNTKAARIDGRKANSAIGKAAATRGLRTVDSEVVSLSVAEGRTTGVETKAGPIAAGHVAIAGGAWSAAFASQLSFTLPVTPMKGQIIHMVLPETETEDWPILQPVFSHYLVPWPGGRVACGGTLEPEAGFDTRPTARGVHELLREGLRTAPGLAQATIHDIRVGLRPASADERPILGSIPGWSNVHVATGHGTEGLLMGPYTAALVAESIVTGSLPPAIAGLSPERFAATGAGPDG
jgi:D-amino-acid dehydrogenase